MIRNRFSRLRAALSGLKTRAAGSSALTPAQPELEAARRECARLAAELETYRHAFESTAQDRDRLSALLDPGVLAAGLPPYRPPVRPDDDAAYGAVWAPVVASFRSVAGDGPLDAASFSKILAEGWFSQFTLYRDATRVDALLAWQMQTLSALGYPLPSLPGDWEESACMPADLTRECDGRRISVDFLRFATYVRVMDEQLRKAGAGAPRTILEIGSGYGGLARLMKIAHPQATICLVDIPVCLGVAEYYLRRSFPAARVTWSGGGTPDPSERPDFLLVPADRIQSLQGVEVDLAINVWSFGEMPTPEIRRWLDLIENGTRARYLFLINHFMQAIQASPAVLREQAGSYAWLRQIGPAWRLAGFEIDPIFECPPQVLHKHRGVMLFGERLSDEAGLQAERAAAAAAAAAVHASDWACGSIVRDDAASGADPASVRTAYLSRPAETIDDTTRLSLDLFSRTIGLHRPDLDRGRTGAFFRLWNDFRLNGSLASLRLLRIWLHLQWAPRASQAGAFGHTLLREELHFALDDDGYWRDDPNLELPDWLRRVAVSVGRG